MKDLFVCWAGLIRSKMAVEIATRLAQEREISDYHADNIGIRNSGNSEDLSDEYKVVFGLTKRTFPDLRDYDRVFIMEDKFRKKLTDLGVSEGKIINLDVTGELERTRASVRKELEEKIALYFSQKK